MSDFMIKRVTRLCMVLMVFMLQGCAVAVGERNVISKDEKPSYLNENDLAAMAALKPNIEVTELSLMRRDGETAKGIWIKQPQSTKVLIYFGGNIMRIKELYERFLPHMLALDTDVVWLDHRGIGGSSGNPSIGSLKNDGLETYDFVSTNSDKKIVLHGFSLGSFVAGHIAANREVSGLVLEGSATTTDDWIDSTMPWYVKAITDVEVEASLKTAGNGSVVRQYQGPLLLIVGGEDEVTPPELSEKLYQQSASTDKQLLVIEGGKHGNAMKHQKAQSAMLQFVGKL